MLKALCFMLKALCFDCYKERASLSTAWRVFLFLTTLDPTINLPFDQIDIKFLIEGGFLNQPALLIGTHKNTYEPVFVSLSSFWLRHSSINVTHG